MANGNGLPRQPDQSDVARFAGVSIGSVSTAINRPDLVSEAMRDRVQNAVAELGYVPNRAAAALRRGGANHLFGLVIPDVTNAFYAAIVDAVVDAADNYNYGVTLCVSHEDPDREQRHFDLLAQQRAAGVIIVPIAPMPERLRTLRTVGTRIVLIDRKVEVDEGCSVSVDDVHGGWLAASHLLDTPGEGVTIVNGARSIPQCFERWEGSRRAVVAAGLPESSLVELTVPQMTVEAGIAAAEQVIATGAPRRIFAINDQLATGVVMGLNRAGLSVPGDTAVIGYGDLGLENGSQLSTIGQPKDEMGQEAVRLLLHELDRPQAHTHSATVFEPRLIARETTAAAR